MRKKFPGVSDVILGWLGTCYTRQQGASWESEGCCSVPADSLERPSPPTLGARGVL